ncbi:hypothetical protein FRC07_006165 [Ceratobasidium sp. 392]|nr:hypothetical protein FRC07_006165 [Ceratobasidium sp. 392]
MLGMSLGLAIPGATFNFPQYDIIESPTSVNSVSKDLIIICLFGSASSCKPSTACNLPPSPEQTLGAPQIQRGTVNFGGDSSIEIWKFPSLYEGDWMRDAETLLCVGAYLERCSGRFRGAVYMRGPEDEDGEDNAFELFKSIVGDDIPEESTVVIPYPSNSPSLEGGFLSNSHTPFDAPLEILTKFVYQPPVEMLYHKEISQPGASLADTSLGKLFEKYLSDAAKAISRARDHIRSKTLATQDPSYPPSTSPRRSRKTTETALTQQLFEVRKQVAELEARSNHFAELTESNTALEAENEELRSQNYELNQIIRALRDEVEFMRVEPSLEDVGIQAKAILVDAGPFQTEPIVDEVVIQQQDEIFSLQSAVARIMAEKDETIARVSQLSKELEVAKATAADSKKTIADLEKTIAGHTKRIEGLEKAGAKHQQNLNDAKAETTTVQKKLRETEDDLTKSKKEIARIQAREEKLEEERRSAIKISEECLKVRDDLKAELATAKSQASAVEKQAKKKVEELQKSLNETSAQVAAISKAAEVWAVASAKVEELEGTIRAERERAELRHHEAQFDIERLRSAHDTEREGWEAERALASAEQQRLENEKEAGERELKEEQELREREAEGYMVRMSELEEWGQSRWDAVGAGCIMM